MADLSEEELQELYAWIDDIPLSRQKKNITRDFSDGVLAAEVVHHFIPRLVELHNYSPANATQQKLDNWKTLNRKVFLRLKFCVSEELLEGVVTGKSGVIEYILTTLRSKIENYLQTVAAHGQEAPIITPSQDANHHQQLTEADYNTHLPWMPLLQESQPDVSRRLGAGGVALQHTEPSPRASLNPIPTQTSTYKPSNPLHASNHPISRIPVPVRVRGHMANNPNGSEQTLLSLIQSTSKSTLPGANANTYGAIAQSTRKPAGPANGGSKRLSRDNTMAMKIRLAEKDQQLLQTQEFIQYLQMKLTRYEHLVQIKDMKIESLKRELEDARTAVRQTQLLQRPYQRR